MLLGPPDKSQLRVASYSGFQKQPTGGCQIKEVVSMRHMIMLMEVVSMRLLWVLRSETRETEERRCVL
jgi:hypothetical protein